jgi:alanine-glyoxylate transaminase/serine-glyoxylate transaminase/serine-pyruvate transaminase
MTPPFAPLDPSDRLLTGPGPQNYAPTVMQAMQKPMLGHLDPEMWEINTQVVEMLKLVYRRSDGLTFPLQCTGTAGMEAGIMALVDPGDTVIAAVAGYFGRRLADMAKRHGANVVEIEVDWGQGVPVERVLEELERHPDARAVCVVHAETSTGVRFDVAELGAAMRDSNTLLFVDTVTSLGGLELESEAWGIDYAYSCTQKCLGAPPGMSPVSLSPRAVERAKERGSKQTFTFDFQLLADYWIKRPGPVYHHTAPILHIYALHEALRLILEEGLEARWRRHQAVGDYAQTQIRERGLDLLADPAYQLPMLNAVRVPDGVDGKDVQSRLVTEHRIEVGGGLGPTAPPIWRLGFMGTNANKDTVDRVLYALDAVLDREPALTSSS